MMRTSLRLSIVFLAFLVYAEVPSSSNPHSHNLTSLIANDSLNKTLSIIQNTNNSIEEVLSGNLSDISGAKDILKNLTFESKELLNKSSSEYSQINKSDGTDIGVLKEFEEMMRVVEQLTNFLTSIIEKIANILEKLQ